MNKEVNEFSHKYDAIVGPSSRMHRRSRRIDYRMWSGSDPSMYQAIPYEEVRCVEIHMPEDRFRALLEHDEWLYQTRQNTFYKTDEAIQIVKQHERETRIRHSNPSVRIAWEKYQTMLSLVDGHYD